jgi:hypothetical protein
MYLLIFAPSYKPIFTVVWMPFPIPKIITVLRELEGFTFTTALDLNMGYYTI